MVEGGENNLPDSGTSMCKGPGAEMNTAHLRP